MSLAEEDIEFLFLPSVINLKKEAEVFSDSYHCPYVQSIPYQIRSALRIEKRVLSPIIRAKYGKREIEKAFFEVADDLGVLHSEIRKAVSVAEDVQEEFKMRIREKGKEVLESLPEKAIVIISRSYNGQDEALNLGLPKKLRDLGVLSIPLDFLSLDSVNVTSEWPNMYWRSGQQILSAAEIVRENSNLFAVYLTNYGCGPDSFISTFFKKKMGEKPHLIIEVDEHSADVGAITRCEAFLDSIKNRRFGPPKRIKRVLLRRGERRRIYIPYMSDHAYALCAAFSACGVDAEVMAKSDEETSYWGRRYTLGRECYPAIVTIGDMVRETKRSDFDPKTSAFFMGGSSGPCRFGQYSMLQRLVLDDLGLSDVPIYAPNQAKDFFKDLELIGKDFERLAWRGIVACDILEKALREKRPYERNRGETEEVYKEYLEKVCCAIRERRDLLPVMREAGAAFSAILVNKERRPVIGLLGEFFVRSNAFSNEDIVKRLEDLGAEVWAAPVNEWFLYRNFRRCMHARLDRDFRTWLKTKIKNWLQVRDEHRLSEPFYNVLRGAKEPSTKDILSWAEPYIHYSFEGEAIMSIGKSFDFAEKRVSGIVNTIPFTCMPGTIAQCILQKVSEDLGGIPCITISYDGLGQANTEIRLEAFVHQAKEFLR
jgi:predicted nucleotide-binding protein (sugar kinase/HSP70/actin superfamily)